MALRLIQGSQGRIETGFESVPGVTWQIDYRGQVLNSSNMQEAAEVEYVEYLSNAANSLQLMVADNLGKWQQNAYIRLGDVISLSLGYDNKVQFMNTFAVQGFDLIGPPDMFVVRGISVPIAAGIGNATQGTISTLTKRYVVYKGQTLSQIASLIALRNGWAVNVSAITGSGSTVVPGALNPLWAVKVQKLENDLEFLMRLAIEAGCVVNLALQNSGTPILVFYDRGKLDVQNPVMTLYKNETVKAYNFHVNLLSSRMYKTVNVSYFDWQTKKVVTASATDPNISTGQVLNVSRKRVENVQQAQQIAQNYLRIYNLFNTRVRMEVSGTTFFRPGAIIALNGWGEFDRGYIVEVVTHKVNTESWITELQLLVALGNYDITKGFSLTQSGVPYGG